jgi:hypothetical protein
MQGEDDALVRVISGWVCLRKNPGLSGAIRYPETRSSVEKRGYGQENVPARPEEERLI